MFNNLKLVSIMLKRILPKELTITAPQKRNGTAAKGYSQNSDLESPAAYELSITPWCGTLTGVDGDFGSQSHQIEQ
jgi:hypothetical protein